MNAILTTNLAAAALLAAVGLTCDPASIPNRNVRDVSAETRAVTAEIWQLVVDNPNDVRVGSEFHVRVFAEGRRAPVADRIEHVYVAPAMENVLSIDVSPYCDGSADPAEGMPACEDLRVDAVLLETYWLSDD